MKKLEDDQRYVAAKNRLVELQLALAGLEGERDMLQGRLNQLATEPKKSKLDEAVDSLIETGEVSLSSLDSLRQSMTQLNDRIAIHGYAIETQTKRIGELVSEISKVIATEMLPEHRANVRAIVKVLLVLDKALIKEHELRDELYVNGIAYSGVIRAMPINRLGTSNDRYSALSSYLLECLAYGFIDKKDLPEKLHKYIPSKGGGVQVQEREQIDPDGWLAV